MTTKKGKALRLLKLSIGALLVLIWTGICVFLLANFVQTPCGYADNLADCGDLRRGTFFLGVAASPLLLVGLPLMVSGLPRHTSVTARSRVTRRILQVCCFVLAAGFALSAIAFLPDLDVDVGSKLLVSLLFGCALAAGWSGFRLAR